MTNTNPDTAENYGTNIPRRRTSTPEESYTTFEQTKGCPCTVHLWRCKSCEIRQAGWVPDQISGSILWHALTASNMLSNSNSDSMSQLYPLSRDIHRENLRSSPEFGCSGCVLIPRRQGLIQAELIFCATTQHLATNFTTRRSHRQSADSDAAYDARLRLPPSQCSERPDATTYALR